VRLEYGLQGGAPQPIAFDQEALLLVSRKLTLKLHLLHFANGEMEFLLHRLKYGKLFLHILIFFFTNSTSGPDTSGN